MSLRVLYVTDRSAGFAGPMIRGLQTQHDMVVRTLDIRTFATQNLYDPHGFREFDRRAWLAEESPLAWERFRWAQLIFVDSSQMALAWVSRARLGRPVAARISLDDCGRPGLELIDWDGISYLVFPDQLTRDRFQAGYPQAGPLPFSVVPPYGSPGRGARSDGLRDVTSIRVVGELTSEPGLATALAVQSGLARWGRQVRLTVDAVPAAGTGMVGRRAGLIADARARGILETVPASDAGEPGYHYVLCASPTLSAAHAALTHIRAGASAVLRKDATCAQSLGGDGALLYENPDQVVRQILRDGVRPRQSNVRTDADDLIELADLFRKLATGRLRAPPASRGHASGLTRHLRSAIQRLSPRRGAAALPPGPPQG